jgi:hypothetical protein
MNGYEQILVVILSTALAVFLILGIYLLVLTIKVVKSVKRVTDKAEHLADKAEAVGEFFHHAAGPMALGRALTTIADTFIHRKDHKRDNKRGEK